MQEPLYYQLLLPVYRASGGMNNARQTIAILRLANLFLSGAGLAVILFWLRRVATNQTYAAIIGLWIVAQPLFLLNTCRVSNDALAVMIGGVVIVLVMGLQPSRIAWQAGLLGLLIGVGGLVKPTDFALFLPAIFAIAWLVRRRQVSVGNGMAALLALTMGFLALTFTYFWRNYHHFGVLVPLPEVVANHAAHRSLADLVKYHDPAAWFSILRNWVINQGLWVGGWSFVQPSPWFTRAYACLLVVCLLGWPVSWAFGRLPRRRADIFLQPQALPVSVVVISAVAGAMVFQASESLAAGGICTTMPWYGALAIPWLMLIVARGALAWRFSRLGYLPAVLGPILFLLTELHSQVFRAIHVYADTAIGPLALKRLALLQNPALGTPTLVGASVALCISLPAGDRADPMVNSHAWPCGASPRASLNRRRIAHRVVSDGSWLGILTDACALLNRPDG